MRDKIFPLLEEIISEGEEDWLPVDHLIGIAKDYPDTQGGDFRSLALELLRELISEGLMQIGDLGQTGFEAWSSSVGESLERFRKGCEEYGWKPMGALWWLANTEKGVAWLRSRERR